MTPAVAFAGWGGKHDVNIVRSAVPTDLADLFYFCFCGFFFVFLFSVFVTSGLGHPSASRWLDCRPSYKSLVRPPLSFPDCSSIIFPTPLQPVNRLYCVVRVCTTYQQCYVFAGSTVMGASKFTEVLDPLHQPSLPECSVRLEDVLADRAYTSRSSSESSKSGSEKEKGASPKQNPPRGRLRKLSLIGKKS